MKLNMNPQPSRSLGPLAKDGIVQVSSVNSVPMEITTLKIRWKVSYRLKGELVEETGEYGSVNIG